MKRSDINPMPEYFDRYINLVADGDLLQAFDDSLSQLDSLDRNLLISLEGKKYASDKWTVNGIIQHVIDFERVFAYRALLFARKEGSPTQSVDESALAATMKAERRTINELLEDLKTARLATKSLFESFDDEMLLNTGICWKYEMSVLAVGFLAIGHQLHHLKVIEDKYYPLVNL